MKEIELGMVTAIRLIQPLKGPLSDILVPMLVTELGIIREVRPLHPLKAPYSISFIVFGIVIEDRLIQFLKVLSLMIDTE